MSSNSDTPNEESGVESSSPSSNSKELIDVLVDDSALEGLRARPSLKVYLQQLWQRRHFINAEARSNALSSGRGNFLGHAWIIINPLLQVAVFVVVFGLVLKVDRGIDNFIGFLIIGIIFFGFATSGLSAGSGLIQSSRNMITSFQFPRAALAVSVMQRNVLTETVKVSFDAFRRVPAAGFDCPATD